MTQLASDPSFLQIEDRLDALGQKIRVQKIVRGAVLFGTFALASFVVAALLAYLIGSKPVVLVVPIVWICAMLAAAFVWIVRPLMMRSEPAQVARLLESRVPHLHNTLTNSVLLASRDDLSNNPWLPQILEENWKRVSSADLSAGARLSDLKPTFIRAGIIGGVFLVAALSMPSTLAHGFNQMMNPHAFVPKMGKGEILEVKPGDATLIFGQSLEITLRGKSPANDDAKLIFDDASAPISLTGKANDDGTQSFQYRIEHVEKQMRYRVELAGTQSQWFDVKVVREVKLNELRLQFTAPAYTRQAERVIDIKPSDIANTPLTAPQGSTVVLTCATDVPVNGAMLQTGESAPVPMELASAGTSRFTGKLTLLDDTPVSILLTDAAGQIIAKLPEQPLTVRCVKDAPPAITMRWPTQDITVAPSAELKIHADLKDDYGLTSTRILTSPSNDQPLAASHTQNLIDSAAHELSFVLKIPDDQRKHGNSLRVQIEAVDNRNLIAYLKDGGPQTSTSSTFEIRFRDPQVQAAEQKENTDKIRARLLEMLQAQQKLHSQTVAWKSTDANAMTQINAGQTSLRDLMQTTADTFTFGESSKIIQKTLLVLTKNSAKEAVDFSAQIPSEKQPKALNQLHEDLQSRQRRVISTLESLLAMLNANPEPTTQPSQKSGGDLDNKADAIKKLDEALKQFIKEEQRILDQSANLAKKPVDQFDEKDKALLEELKMAQEKLDAFMQQKVSDWSKLSEQDMANASMLKELMEIYSEVTMAKDALKDKAMEIAVPAEEAGIEAAKSLESNLEKWLMDKPDRIKWTQEEMAGKTDVPMPELPKELEDMVGDLLEEQEDLFEEMEDMNANIADSPDKGAGWDAADGPIASMSAKGVTGNQLPNNNEMNGRSGEGRSGKSAGEFVEDTATGKGGRNTPTRLDPTPFQQGQVKDESKDPVGGATGGGKTSGQGGHGLEGPLAPQMKQEMERLAQKQAELRNQAERLNLQYQLGRYDNFKLTESIALMRRTESDLKSNRYQTALRRREMTLDAMNSSRDLLSGQLHVQHDTTPTTNAKLEQDIHDAMKGQLPAAWSDALKAYYKKLSNE